MSLLTQLADNMLLDGKKCRNCPNIISQSRTKRDNAKMYRHRYKDGTYCSKDCYDEAQDEKLLKNSYRKGRFLNRKRRTPPTHFMHKSLALQIVEVGNSFEKARRSRRVVEF